jgi:hypothetical protein
MQDIMDFTGNADILGDIVPDKTEIFIMKEMSNVLQGAGNQVIHADYPKTLPYQPVAKVAADEARPAGN